MSCHESLNVCLLFISGVVEDHLQDLCRVIGGGYGTLAAGAAADVTIFDPDFSWTVDPEAFASKGRNTPLTGQTLRGRVMLTIYSGQTVHRDAAFGDGA